MRNKCRQKPKTRISDCVDRRIAIFLYIAGGLAMAELSSAKHNCVPAFAARKRFLETNRRFAVFEIWRSAHWRDMNELDFLPAQTPLEE